jgi:(p)ppGpp synthase/HD superfamily hydrolase
MTAAAGIEAAAERSPLVRRALETARRAHEGQARDDGAGPAPFLRHLLEVGEQLSREGEADEVLAAGLLHDTIESGGLTRNELRAEFGDPIAHLVDVLSERPEIDSHEDRKDDLRARVAAAGADAQAIYAADKLSNVESLREGYRSRGEAVDEALKVSLDEKMRVWEQDLEMLRAHAGGTPLVQRLADALAELAAERAPSEA